MTEKDRDKDTLTTRTHEQAARQAAARFANDAVRTVAYFAALTGRSELLRKGGQEALEEEMRDLLPVYRYPAHDEHSEYLLSFDPDGPPQQETDLRTTEEEAGREQRAYRAYVRLVRSGGLSRRQALARVRELHAFPDDHAVLEALHIEMEVVIRRWQRSAPCMVQALLDTRWRGLLPPLETSS